MLNLTEDKYRQLINICIMHYQDGLTQQQIAQRIGVSRPQVSRLLASAKTAGIVKISIENPFSEEYRTERLLREAYGLSDVSIVNVPDSETSFVARQMAQLVSMQFDMHLKDNGILGIIGGHTIYNISQSFSSSPRKDISVVSLAGGSEKSGNRQANNSAHTFSEKLGCAFFPMPTPLVVASSEVRNILSMEPDVSRTIEKGNQSTVALIGIGCVDENSAYFAEELFDSAILNRLRSQGAVAGIGGSFMDSNGRILDFSERDRIFAISAEKLKAIPKVIAVAYGRNKAQAIDAVLTGRWVDILITTLDTAKVLLELKK